MRGSVMLEKKEYANGQKIYEMIGNTLTYFYKNGNVKAVGSFVNDWMEGEWKFYRETGQLWQVAHFLNNKKNGIWTRFDKNDQIEYLETFEMDKKVNKKASL